MYSRTQHVHVFVNKFPVFYHNLWEKFCQFVTCHALCQIFVFTVATFTFEKHLKWGTLYSADFGLDMLGLNET